uniref:Uncharacterized protein n=1 Tax=Setaria viridis TaxID=4556 RepID=A0A4U6UED7_SETVI|nr:hypothetical protein SEVIR_5G156450v2 [Setaria viridis]
MLMIIIVAYLINCFSILNCCDYANLENSFSFKI